MPNGLISILVVTGGLLVVGLALGIAQRKDFSLTWLIAALALTLAHDAVLTNGYGQIPSIFPGAGWNWQGKILSILLTLGIAAALGFRRVGLTLAQNHDGRPLTWLAAALLCALFAWPALTTPNEALDPETLAFQLTMPGLEEEPFYRGVLLLAFNEAFRGRVRALGVSVGWGALLTSLLFGLDHAFRYNDGAFAFDPMTMLVTAAPALLLVWFRERTGSLVLPVLLHNFANSIGHLL